MGSYFERKLENQPTVLYNPTSMLHTLTFFDKTCFLLTSVFYVKKSKGEHSKTHYTKY